MKVIDFKNASCKHCYKCVRSCSVKAIQVRDAQATILDQNCVLCGKCLEVCPQNAKTFASDLNRVKAYIEAGEKVVVSLAPAYLGILPFRKPGQVVDALLKLGFSEVRETAEGAALVTNEFARLLGQGQMKNVISTCCPSVNDLVEKYYPELVQYLAPVVSPMIAHGRLIRKMYGQSCKIVFAGPCIAKKKEAEGDDRTSGFIDAVLTFEELEAWLAEKGIVIEECEEKQPANPDPKVNRLYPVTKGVVTSVLARHEEDSYRKIFVDGIENCRDLFEDMKNGLIEGCFIEANMCEGGCIKGPGVRKLNISRYKAAMDVEEHTDIQSPSVSEDMPKIEISRRFRPSPISAKMPTEEELQEILKATGKYNKTQELNCGACGYPSCREKAIAVFQGKAEMEMCVPYVYEKAKSMANIVFDVTPEMFIIADNAFQILEFNRAAEETFHISRAEARQKLLFELMDVTDFEYVLTTHVSVLKKRVEIPESGKVFLGNIVYMEEEDACLGIFHDITEEEEEAERRMNMKMDTIAVAQTVIDKQMMVAQEIAGLLGETTAETKVILTQLRDSIMNDTDLAKTPKKEAI